MRLSEVKEVVREGVWGIAAAIAIGVLSRLLQWQVPQADALVVAVVLGMVVRWGIGDHMAVFFKLVPGLTTAEAIFLPLGVMLYGKNLELNVMLRAHPGALAQTALIVAVTFAAILGIGSLRWFALSKRMLFALGFGSAVCGASAIAITAPVTECEPDETATALVDNTIAVMLAVAFLGWVMKAALSPSDYAALAGETLHQTAFVKRAVSGLAPATAEFGMAVKAFRIGLLVISVPIAARLLRHRVIVPWYIVAFFLVGVVFWLVPLPSAFVNVVGNVQGVALPAALASVGLRADLRVVASRLAKPLVLVLLVFAIDVGVFLATRGLAVAR